MEVYYLLSILLAKIGVGVGVCGLDLEAVRLCSVHYLKHYYLLQICNILRKYLMIFGWTSEGNFEYICHYGLITQIHSYEKVFFSFPGWEMPRFWVNGASSTHLLWAVWEANLHVKSLLNVVAVKVYHLHWWMYWRSHSRFIYTSNLRNW